MGTEIIDEGEEEVIVCGGCLMSSLGRFLGGKKLKGVLITVMYKDQGWSGYPEDHDAYRNSWTWFELSVRSPSEEPGEEL